MIYLCEKHTESKAGKLFLVKITIQYKSEAM